MPSPIACQPPDDLDPDIQAAIGAVHDLYDPPLWLVTAADGATRGGLVATFVARASIVPSLPRMIAGIAKHHHTWGLIEASGGFALHLLSPDQLELVWRFGLQSGHQTDKFAGLARDTTPSGQPRLPEALAWLDCRVETRTDTGDRTLYLAAVTAGSATSRAAPLTAGGLYRAAPPERRARLERLYARDGEIDAEAIHRWRARSARP
ncbi:flavin reductase family protein [Thiococcus pfennigii]|jgi:flavin reductase (DIM6/NTAB) family NADH-FMN oxidoreductase RutF|uniref:flavin reductase family protein n=1 Tax=Thiococcus pfennigii TaxID=1057 RepID=UPI001903483C|nr:flavin reductase family protein [Thiococcus pfennigii]MBK1699722.1 flavin reductase [Thiococcus pfennigii]MBK1731070.1 flavin reductase [Thiococcus pfennigii]